MLDILAVYGLFLTSCKDQYLPKFNFFLIRLILLFPYAISRFFLLHTKINKIFFFSFSIAPRRLRRVAMHVNLGQNFLNQLRKSTGNSLRICKDFNSISAFFSIDTNIEKTSRNAKFK